MPNPERRSFLVGTALLASAVAGAIASPTRRLASELPPLNLETAVPQAFGDWKLVSAASPVLPSADTRELLDRLYSQVLSRSYVNSSGAIVMFVIAYGADQADRTTLAHLPQVCYAAQGFDVDPLESASVVVANHDFNLLRLRTRKGLRVEPVTYWTTVGTYAQGDEVSRRESRALYALKGIIPDGMLVRTSNITNDVPSGYALQVQFIQQLYAALSEDVRPRIYGTFA